MGDHDSRWERIRVIVGVAIIAGCGISLWRNSVRPLVEKGVGGGDLVHEVRLGVYRWALERKRLQLQQEEREERERRAREEELSGQLEKGSPRAVGTGTQGAGP